MSKLNLIKARDISRYTIIQKKQKVLLKHEMFSLETVNMSQKVLKTQFYNIHIVLESR